MYTKESKHNIENIINRYFTGHKVHTPWMLVESIIQKIKTSTNKEIAVLYNVEWVFTLIFLKGVKSKNITFFGDCEKKRKLVEGWGCNYVDVSVLLENNIRKEYCVKFDIIVGNPPFNIREETDSTITGVSGKTNLFKDFVKMIPSLIKPGGTIGFITPKGVVKMLQEHDIVCNYDVVDFNLMSESNYWKYDTCYFILKATKIRNNKLVPSDHILSKILDLSLENNWKTININKSDKELIREDVFGGNIKCIRYLPGRRGNSVTTDSVKTDKYLIPKGPKVVGTHLNSSSSITATNDAVCAGTTMTIPTNTIDEAKALALFIRNNLAVKYFVKQANVKKLMVRFSWFKKFDLEQIKTGYEYPVEWNLTANEIKKLEEIIG
jgi:hypothetical protein